MFSLKLKFRPSTAKGGEGRLYWRIIYMRDVRQVTTDYRIAWNEWNETEERLLIGEDGSARSDYLRYVQDRIESDRRFFRRMVRELCALDGTFSVDVMAEEYQKRVRGTTLFSYMESTIAELRRYGQDRTSETYTSTLNSFRRFRKDRNLYFQDLDSELLLSYECHLKARELSLNTISFYMKRLRAVYNKAAEDGLTDGANPFRKVFTSSEKTVKRALPLKAIKKLKDLDLSSSASKGFARDMFLFSFYTRGMSFVDIAYLRKKDLQDKRLTYRRKKTGRLLSLHWEPCMQEIAGRYSSLHSPYLISIIKNPAGDTRKQYHNVLTLINRNLKEVGKSIGLQMPLTMYVARHSWASIARSEGIPLSVISESMGHDSERTTLIYLSALEPQTIDRANRKILKLLQR